MAQALFEVAVKKAFPSAIPSKLDRIDEYSLGKVLTYPKKPRKLIPLRKQELELAGPSVHNLLTEKEGLTVTAVKAHCFDTNEDSSVEVDLRKDVQLEDSIKLDTTVNLKGIETLHISTDFGKVTCVSSDLVSGVIAGKVKLRPDHPTVQTAIKNGGVIFVITNVFEAAHCNLSLTLPGKEGGSKNVGRCTFVK